MAVTSRKRWFLLMVGLAAIGGYATVTAQQPESAATPPAAVTGLGNPAVPSAKGELVAKTGKFEFEVIESFDAKYQGDTPGHIGKHGELGDFRPSAALGDPVFRRDKKIGTVTNLVWSRGHGSLEVEFDPEPNVRISVGDVVWLKMADEKD